jgi:spore coat protein U-like protein
MSFLIRRLSVALLAAALMLVPQKAVALSTCGILCSCTISVTTINLGGYNPIANTATTATGSLTVSCQLLSAIGTVLEPFTVSLSQGHSSTFAARQMTGSTATTLNYNLFSNAAMTSVWGDGTGISQILSSSIQVSVLNLLTPQIQTIFAQIPAGQKIPAGSYSDTITATLQF